MQTEDGSKTLNIVPVETDELLIAYGENPTVENRNKVVKKYINLVEIISKKFYNRGIDYEDIYQVASIALINSVERFNINKGVKFISFATPTILGEIKRHFRDKGSTIRVPRRIYEVYQKVNYAREYLSHELQRPPQVNEIAGYLKLSEETVLEIMESWNVYNMQSFDQNVFSEDNLELHEIVGEEDASFERIENNDFLEKSLEKFNEPEKDFIKMRYKDNATQKEIADKMGVSQMFVSRLEKKIIRKFRILLNK